MQIVQLPSDFFTSGRGQPIRYVVMHTTEGIDSRLWLTRTGRASAHYLIRGDVIYQLVREEDTAWHAGNVGTRPLLWSGAGANPNDESIGIELEGLAAVPLPQLVVDTAAELVRDIRRRRGPLPMLMHGWLSDQRSDPGLANYERIAGAVAGLGTMPADQMTTKIDRALAMLEQLVRVEHWTAPMIWTARVQRGRDVERGTTYDPAVPPKDPRVIVPDE